ncbi:MAG: winged helix-turn-helix transcriptional regulator [Candidatus Aenigmatarchaeota archaeon]
MNKGNIETIRLVGQPYILEILNALAKHKRFSELKDICKNERTLSKKLNILRQNGLIDVMPVLVKNRYENHYKLTKKGEDFLKKIRSI